MFTLITVLIIDILKYKSNNYISQIKITHLIMFRCSNGIPTSTARKYKIYLMSLKCVKLVINNVDVIHNEHYKAYIVNE